MTMSDDSICGKEVAIRETESFRARDGHGDGAPFPGSEYYIADTRTRSR